MYIPYNGPAGPTAKQKENNTLALAELLEAANIPYAKDRQWSALLWGGEDLNLAITKGDVTIFAGYDRWGFVVESEKQVSIDVDQLGINETLEAIKNWYNS